MSPDPVQRVDLTDAVPAYGSAVIQAHYRDGTTEVDRLEVVCADPVIGIAVQLLADDPAALPVDADGCLLLAGDPAYRYRPIRFASTRPWGPPQVLVCARVEGP